MKVAIIGAGFAGLSAAWDLAGAGHDVVVFDAMDKPGGLAAGFRDERWDWPLEHFYHHIFLSDDAILGLAAEVGFDDRVMRLRPVSASFVDGQAHALDGVLPVLRFPAIPLIDRIRMGLVGAWLKARRDWHRLEHVTAHRWARRWMGPRAYEVVWEPLLIGKFGEEYYRDIPMSWLWARIHARTFRLGYFRGGFQAYADHLMRAVEGRGATVRLGTPVTTIRHRDGNTSGGRPILVRTDAGDEHGVDRVIATTGPHIFAGMAPDLPEQYLARLRELDYLGAVVFVLALREPLMTDGTYWLNMDKRDFPFLAVVEHTNLLDREHYGGDHVVYVGDYLPPDHRYFEMAPEEVLDEWLPALGRIQPGFSRGHIRDWWLSRTRYAQPVVPTGFGEHIPPLETPIPGVYLASMSQVYPWDRGTNFAVEIGRKAARRVMADPHLHPARPTGPGHRE